MFHKIYIKISQQLTIFLKLFLYKSLSVMITIIIIVSGGGSGDHLLADKKVIKT